MIKIVVSILVSLFFVACSTHTKQIKPNEKAFDAEDAYILYALRAEQVGGYKTASKLYDGLYQKAAKKEYLYKSLQNLYLAKEYEKVIQKVDTIISDPASFDATLVRIKVLSLAQLDKLIQAQTLAKELAKKSGKPNDYILAGDILIKSKKYDEALRYLDSAYMKGYDEAILDKIAILLYVNLKQKKEAIARLETHTRVHGCSEKICNRLIGIYSNENNLDGLLSVYKRKYELTKESEIAKKIIQIYGYKRDYVQLMNFLEQSGEDDALLLQLYTSAKDFKQAQKLAKKMYEKEGVVDYLGQSAIYEYEANKDNLNQQVLKNVTATLEEVVSKSSDPLYLNYLGYILIDHDLDVKKGMQYVKQVLKIKPESAYYLDSLAWGYYKLHQCHKAKKLIEKVRKLEGGDDPEVLLHVKKIDQCLK